MRLAGSLENKVILDIGCADGWFERFAVEMGCKEIAAIDTDAVVLAKASKQVTGKEVTFLKGSASDLSMFNDGYFDMIVLLDVIEHVPKGLSLLL